MEAIINVLKNMEEEVIKKTTLELLDEYLYQINLLSNDFFDLEEKHNRKKDEYNTWITDRIHELLSTEEEKHKTKAEEKAKHELKDLKEEVNELSYDVDKVKWFLRKSERNYHHWRSKLMKEYDMGVQVNQMNKVNESVHENLDDDLPF